MRDAFCARLLSTVVTASFPLSGLIRITFLIFWVQPWLSALKRLAAGGVRVQGSCTLHCFPWNSPRRFQSPSPRSAAVPPPSQDAFPPWHCTNVRGILSC
ncbi:hypothetical protein HDV63DRAFT_365459 [Trichoderma sp. SZMC 28014]